MTPNEAAPDAVERRGPDSRARRGAPNTAKRSAWRPPAHDRAAEDRLAREREFVGAVLADTGVLAETCVRPDDLRDPSARAVLEAVVELGDAGRAEGGICDLQAIRDYLTARPLLDGGLCADAASATSTLFEMLDLPQLSGAAALGRRIRLAAVDDSIRAAAARVATGELDGLDELEALRADRARIESREPELRFEPLAPIDAPELTSFPTGALGPAAGFVAALSGSAQVPAELVGPAVLGFLAGAVARRAVVDTGSWREEIALYVAAIASPGTRKSAVWARCSAPIEALEAELLAGGAGDREAAAARGALLARRLSGVESRYAKAPASEREALEAEAVEIRAEQREAEAASRPARLLAGDVTPERLAGLMAANGERLILASAEGAMIFDRLGRYSQGGEPSLDLLLSAWCGEPVRIDRQSGEAIAMRRPCLTIVAALQPDVMRTLGRQPSFSGRGLLDRFAWTVPADLRGFRDVRSTVPMDRDAEAAYHRLARRLLELPDGDAPMVLSIEGGAREAFLDAAQGFEDLQREGEELEDARGWASKAAGLVARLAGLLALLRAADERRAPEIDRVTVEAATRLGIYFADHTRRAFELLDGRTGDGAVDKLVRWLRRRDDRSSPFSKRDLWQGVKGGRFSTAGDLDAPLRRLREAGWIARQTVPSDRAGRPTEIWILNPEAPL